MSQKIFEHTNKKYFFNNFNKKILKHRFNVKNTMPEKKTI